jgi:hypothetical protein
MLRIPAGNTARVYHFADRRCWKNPLAGARLINTVLALRDIYAPVEVHACSPAHTEELHWHS